MDNWISFRIAAAEQGRRDHGDAYEEIVFPSEEEAAAEDRERRAILDRLGDRILTGASGTKLDCRGLAPGCRACMEGNWSCLFINSRCNCRCFYCPSEQDEVAEPVTNNLSFPRASEYMAYLERFGFTGVSISGGEPLLDLERTLEFLLAIKRRLGDGIHTWLYSNGMLMTPGVARQLREAGLGELRLDISATSYRLDAVAAAAGIIPTITVEIPAIPEDEQRLAGLLGPMAGAGVAHLNLHQLKATAHSLPAMASHGYTYLHGEQLTVMGSELCALRLVESALDQGVALPVNYCSLVYKLRFQRAAARRRSAEVIRRGHEDICESGLLCQLSANGPVEAVAALGQRLAQAGAPRDSWALEPGSMTLRFSASRWQEVQPWPWIIGLTYQLPRTVPSVTYRNPFVEVPLGRGRKIAVERGSLGEVHELGPADAALYALLVLPRDVPQQERPEQEVRSPALARVMELEQIKAGLQEYL